MPIGTSLGAYYPSEADFQTKTFNTNDNNVVAPADTGDNNTQFVGKDLPLPSPAKEFKVNDIKTNNPLVTFTDKDIDTGIGLATGFMGGGLSTAEKIKSAALQYGGKIYEDINHGFALNRILDETGGNALMKEIKDGFTTTKGRFISREEAFDIAKDQNQINEETLPALTSESKMLLSEDLSR